MDWGKSEAQSEKSSPKSSASESEVNGSVPLTPLTASTSRTDQMHTQSPKLVRRTAFRETVKKHRKDSHESPVICASPNPSGSVVFTLDPAEFDHSPSVSSPSCVSSDPPDSNCLENGFGAALPTTHTKQSSTSSKASGASSEMSDSSSRNVRSREKSHATEGKKARKKSGQRSVYTLEADCGSPTLKHASSAPYSLMSDDDGVFEIEASYHHPALEQNRLNRSPSWYAYKIPRSPADSERSEDHSVPAAPLQGCRSASLDELNNIGVSYGLPIISPLDAKKKNYLFGGLNSLLGASELDRYFPNRTINLFIATWNMNGKEPPANLEAFLLPDEMEHMPDMFVLGTQESGGSRSEWEVRLQATIGPSHVLFTSAIFGVLHLTIFLRRDLVWFCSVPEDATYSLRPGIAYKTKGGMAIGFQFFGTRMLFINSHLTAHEEKQALRIQNFRSISRSLDIPRLLPTKIKHKDVTHRYDCVFWLGDLNFRLAVNRDHVFERLKTDTADTYQHLLQWDQLSQARKKGEAFADFEEGTIHFPPTFKYDPGTDHYDTSSKQRVPSYTDRILFKSKRGDISCISYASCPLFRTSDHKPVLGHFTCKIRPGKDDSTVLSASSIAGSSLTDSDRRGSTAITRGTEWAMSDCPAHHYCNMHTALLHHAHPPGTGPGPATPCLTTTARKLQFIVPPCVVLHTLQGRECCLILPLSNLTIFHLQSEARWLTQVLRNEDAEAAGTDLAQMTWYIPCSRETRERSAAITVRRIKPFSPAHNPCCLAGGFGPPDTG
ncbi:phosphatidylinositol polyphosphate 5-phosphatase type IV-like isoform X13 [Portunus trituberculatus]|uniref:phosphatidylinositol polyphosphate 5-phosphatase type IV-like isoform X13 n=1 Tax=Portunus trituberculatus TaxID=210409 RepID=UPI001E1D13A1|nr:phosphatidylinositol polyphosphate 5-phosphatase type IV-like isoform X13 [Portunus trituberculatus]